MEGRQFKGTRTFLLVLTFEGEWTIFVRPAGLLGIPGRQENPVIIRASGHQNKLIAADIQTMFICPT